MSKSTYLKELKDALSIPLITTPEEFRMYWGVYQYMRARALRLLTSEIREFCDKEVIEKIRREDNEYLGIILHQSLQTIISYLKAKGKKFRLGVYLYRDSDVPEWEGFTILINVDYKDFDEKMFLWEGIEDKISNIFERLKKEDIEGLRKIERANELIATSIQKLE